MPGRSPARSSNSPRIRELRNRLGSLSWFMRLVNEPLARIANREDGVSGRFWEGRFRSIVLLDEVALLACMVYVDLNPIRASVVERIEDAANTSIHRRINQRDDEVAMPDLSFLGLSLSSYRELLEWTVSLDEDSHAIPTRLTTRALSRLECESGTWSERVHANRRAHRAHGAPSRLQAHAESLGQRWIWAPQPKRDDG